MGEAALDERSLLAIKVSEVMSKNRTFIRDLEHFYETKKTLAEKMRSESLMKEKQVMDIVLSKTRIIESSVIGREDGEDSVHPTSTVFSPTQSVIPKPRTRFRILGIEPSEDKTNSPRKDRKLQQKKEYFQHRPRGNITRAKPRESVESKQKQELIPFIRRLANGVSGIISFYEANSRLTTVYKYYVQDVKRQLDGEEINCREGAQMIMLDSGNSEKELKLVLFGGQGCGAIRDLLQFNGELHRWDTKSLWSQGLIHNITINHHSMIYVDGTLVIMGGMQRIGDTVNRVSGEVYFINMATMEVSKLSYKEDGCPAPRRLHSCALSGNTIVLYGGLSESNHTYQDVWFFSTRSRAWTQATVRHSGYLSTEDFTTGLAGHQMVAVNRDSMATAKSLVYIFGGYSPEYGESDQLFSLEMLELIATVTRIEGKGKPPGRRYNHSLSLLDKCSQAVTQSPHSLCSVAKRSKTISTQTCMRLILRMRRG